MSLARVASQVEVGLTPADLPDPERLARGCLDGDGGFPSFAHETMLDSRLLRDQTSGLRLADGTLAAAAGIGHKEGTATTSGMVHPTERHRGIGNRLLPWAIEIRRRHTPGGGRDLLGRLRFTLCPTWPGQNLCRVRRTTSSHPPTLVAWNWRDPVANLTFRSLRRCRGLARTPSSGRRGRVARGRARSR